MTRLRLQLEGGIQFLLAQLVIWIGLAVGNIYPLNLPVGRIVRWAVLAELGVFALAYAVTARSALRFGRSIAAIGLFLALAFLSVGWSPNPGLTFGRATSFAAVIAVGLAIAVGTQRGSDGARPFLLALLAGTAVIALLGLFQLAHDYDRAVVPATRGQGARYTGIGGNPDTFAMLYAIVSPIAFWAFLEARARWEKIAAAATFVLLDGSLAASSSRGAIVAAFVGLTAMVLLLRLRRRTRVVLAAASVALFAANALAGTVPPRAAVDPVLYTQFGVTPALAPNDANTILPLENEIGFPGRGGSFRNRELLDAGGRRPAWEGALRQVSDRPIAGYGFGLEERVFVDRYYPFISDRPESSYIGLLLQLGAAGLLVLLVVFALVARDGVRALRAAAPTERIVTATCLSVVATGAVLALAQSYITSVGSPPTVPLWICALLLVVPARSSTRP
jgi:O-Antigen ligase